MLNIPKSTLSDWKKLDFSAEMRNSQGHLPKSGRPVSYGKELDDKILQWILAQRDMQVPVSIDAICAYARELVRTENPKSDFQASRQWVDKFLKRHDLSLRARTSLAQRLPADLESKLDSFHNFVRDRREEDEFDDEMMINMDETPAYFDLVPGKTVNLKGEKSVLIRTTGADKRHLTVVLGVAASGDVLPPMVIFKGKRQLKDITHPPGWIVTVQEKAWMDGPLMLRWIREIYRPYTKRARSLCVLDSFRGHLTDDVKKEFRKSNAVMAVIPGGCTSKVQPLDVSVNKPFKSHLRKSWTGYVANEAARVMEDPESERLKTASKQEIVNWIASAVDSLRDNAELVKRSFCVCGISNHLNGCEDQLRRNADYIRELLCDDSDDDEDFEGFTEADL